LIGIAIGMATVSSFRCQNLVPLTNSRHIGVTTATIFEFWSGILCPRRVTWERAEQMAMCCFLIGLNSTDRNSL